MKFISSSHTTGLTDPYPAVQIYTKYALTDIGAVTDKSSSKTKKIHPIP